MLYISKDAVGKDSLARALKLVRITRRQDCSESRRIYSLLCGEGLIYDVASPLMTWYGTAGALYFPRRDKYRFALAPFSIQTAKGGVTEITTPPEMCVRYIHI